MGAHARAPETVPFKGEPLPVGLDRAGHPPVEALPQPGSGAVGVQLGLALRVPRATTTGPQPFPVAPFSWCSTWRAVGVEAGVQLGEPLPVGLDRAGHPPVEALPQPGSGAVGVQLGLALRVPRATTTGPQPFPVAPFSWCSTWRAVGVEAGVQLGEPLPVGLDRAGHPPVEALPQPGSGAVGVQLGRSLPRGSWCSWPWPSGSRGSRALQLGLALRVPRATTTGPQPFPVAPFSWCSTWRAVGVEAGVQLGEPLPVGLDRAGHPPVEALPQPGSGAVAVQLGLLPLFTTTLFFLLPGTP